MSVFNAQTLITPAAYVAGHDPRQGPERHRRLEAGELQRATGATFARNDAWWGGKTPLDGTEFIFFDDTGADGHRLPGPAGRRHRAVRRAVAASRCSTDPNFNVIATDGRTASPDLDALRHGPVRQEGGPPGARLTFDRPALIQQLFQGKARARQRPRHLAGLSVLRPVRPAARPGHRQGQAAARRRRRDGPHGDAALRPAAGDPGPRALLIQSQARQAGITLNVAVESLNTFYGAQWCPRQAGRPAVLRRGRARHRRLRPPGDPGRLPQRGAQDEGHLELVAVLVAGVRRGVHGVPDARSASTPRRPPAPRSRRSSTTTRRSGCRTSTTTWPATPRTSPASTRARSGRCSSRRPPRSPDRRSHVRTTDRSIGLTSTIAMPG